MFDLTQTFRSDSKVITPILFQENPIFLTQEIGPMLGYADLANSIKTSPTFMREGKEYIILEGRNLKGLKDLLRSVGPTNQPPQVLDTIKFSPKLIVLTKGGLQTLLLRSDKPAAVEYKDWVIYEVLPALEKGQLPQQANEVAKQESVAKELLKCRLEVADLFEIPKHLGQVEAVKTVKQICNIDFSSLLLQAPAQSNLKEEDIFLEPTELGVRLNLGSAIKTNKILNELGLQIKISRTWVPTKEGVKISSIHQWNRGGKSGDNLKWNLSKVKEILSKKNSS